MKNKILLLAMMFLPVVASAETVWIDGIYYNLKTGNGDWAEVTNRNGGGYNCTSYSGSMDIPTTVTYEGREYSVTSIGNYAFYGCSGLTSVMIPSSVTCIEKGAFYRCSGLTSITIPNSVMSIGNDAFNYCSGLTSVTIGNSVTSIGERAFHDTGWYNDQPDGILYLDKWVISVKGENPIGTLVIAEGTRGLADYAFQGCSGLTSITIPNSVTSIGNHAFEHCKGLTSVTIPDSVTSIGQWAFYFCSDLTSVTIPNSVTNIGEHAFSMCI